MAKATRHSRRCELRRGPLKSTSFFMILLIVVLGAATTPAWADIVPVKNASFEDFNPLDTPCRIPDPGSCAFNFGPIPDWILTGDGGSWRPTAVFYNLPLPD